MEAEEAHSFLFSESKMLFRESKMSFGENKMPFGESKKIACAVRHNRIQLYCNTVVSHCACNFFSKFWNDKMNFTRSSSPSHREGPETEVVADHGGRFERKRLFRWPQNDKSSK